MDLNVGLGQPVVLDDGFTARRGRVVTSLIRRAAFAFGRWNRRRKAAFALRLARRLGVRTILLVGVAGVRNPVNDLVEHTLAEGLSYPVASGLARAADGWDPYVVADARNLPFRTGAFDLVYANAVIEHVGGDTDQRQMMAEIDRVGRAWIVTTPNRWFPVESHFHTFLTHWRSGWAPRGGVTRLLGIRDFRRLMPPSGRVRGLPVVSPTLTAVGRRPVPS